MARIIPTVLFAACLSLSASAASDRENVVISEASDVYTFVDTPAGLIVKTVERTQYETLRHSDKVVPNIYYCDDITLDKVSGGKAQYRNVNSANVFHDDSRVCFFEIDLKEKGANAKAEFRRTFKDAAQFAKICVANTYPTRKKLIKFEIPASHPEIDFIFRNFQEGKFIRNDKNNLDGSRTILLDFTDIPGYNDEKASPVPLDCEPYILIKGYFKDLDALYDYHRGKLDVDTVIPDVGAVLAEAGVAAGADRADVVRNVYRFVQQKIRYVAYEEGEAGYRPDKPAEVLRKNYGDCKGMALLLATLLNRAGVEANIATIGTSRIPFRIADCPSLAATNHMICIAPAENYTLYLDATCEHISSRDIPGSIQGKDAMMFTCDGYEMVNLPVLAPDKSGAEALFEYEISDGKIIGKVSRRYTGDMLESVLSTVNGLNRTYAGDAFALMVRPRKNVNIEKGSIESGYLSDSVYGVSAAMTDDNALTDLGDVMYVDMSVTSGFSAERVDLADRRSDYELPFRTKIVSKSALLIPEGYELGELPDDFHADCGGVGLECRFYTADDGRVYAEKILTVDDVRVPRGSLEDWNKAVSAWNDAAAHQIELLKK